MNTETFDFEETTEAKRFTVVLDADTNVTEREAREAVRDLVESNTVVTDSTSDTDNEQRTYKRGHEA